VHSYRPFDLSFLVARLGRATGATWPGAGESAAPWEAASKASPQGHGRPRALAIDGPGLQGIDNVQDACRLEFEAIVSKQRGRPYRRAVRTWLTDHVAGPLTLLRLVSRTVAAVPTTRGSKHNTPLNLVSRTNVIDAKSVVGAPGYVRGRSEVTEGA
jgi:hypothetical protein